VRAQRPQVREQEMVTARHHRQSHHHRSRRQGKLIPSAKIMHRAELSPLGRAELTAELVRLFFSDN
jgi:hypothetical protein